MCSFICGDWQCKKKLIRRSQRSNKRVPGPIQLCRQPTERVGRHCAHIDCFANLVRYNRNERFRLPRYAQSPPNALIYCLPLVKVLIQGYTGRQLATGNVIVTFMMFDHIERAGAVEVKCEHAS